MDADELLEHYENSEETETIEVVFKSVNAKKQIVYGEVYTPYVLDTHGEMMLPADVELMCHRFMSTLKNNQIDLMHNNRTVNAVAVESFIARKDDPDYNEGAWVLGTKIEDAELWGDIESGKYNGYSMECLVTKADAIIEFDYLPHIYGWTEKADGHDHAFFIQVNNEGTIVGGATSKDADHDHIIKYATATEASDKHAHRFLLQ